MVGDHTRAANRARRVLSDMGATTPAAMLEPEHYQKLDALKAATNPQFDQAYVEAQCTAHVGAIALMTEYARTGDNERLKALAAEIVPTLQGLATKSGSEVKNGSGLG
jgi:putative membrane protein